MSAYIVGYNMPGYLPEMLPYAFGDWDSAKRALIDEMDRSGDMIRDQINSDTPSDDAESMNDEADELSLQMEDLNLDNGPEWGTIIGNTAYWIAFVPDADPSDWDDE